MLIPHWEIFWMNLAKKSFKNKLPEFQEWISPELPATFLQSMSQSTFFYLLKPTLLSNVVFGSSKWKPGTRTLSIFASFVMSHLGWQTRLFSKQPSRFPLLWSKSIFFCVEHRSMIMLLEKTLHCKTYGPKQQNCWSDLIFPGNQIFCSPKLLTASHPSRSQSKLSTPENLCRC